VDNNWLRFLFSYVGRAHVGIAQESRIRENAAPTSIGTLGQTPRTGRQEKESVQRQVESTDGMIDKLVYELYGLTEKEIGIVEGK